jgi:hypothetical protein
MAVLAALLPVVAVAGLLSARSLCACGDPEMFWGGKLRMSPVSGDPQKLRAAIFEQLPPGSSAQEVGEFIQRASQSPVLHRRCNDSPREIACHFPVMEEWFGLKKRGFFVRFTMDEKGGLADAAVRGYDLWFEEPR